MKCSWEAVEIYIYIFFCYGKEFLYAHPEIAQRAACGSNLCLEVKVSWTEEAESTQRQKLTDFFLRPVYSAHV